MVLDTSQPRSNTNDSFFFLMFPSIYFFKFISLFMVKQFRFLSCLLHNGNNGFSDMQKQSVSRFLGVFVVVLFMLIGEAHSQTHVYFGTGWGSGTGGLAIDPSDNLYASNTEVNAIRKKTPSGFFSNFVTSGLSSPTAMACDASGNLYVCNSNYISKINSTGSVSSFVSLTNRPVGLTFDNSGNLYTLNGANANNILKVSSTGSVSTFVSSVTSNNCVDITYDKKSNNFYATDGANIYKISSTGVVTTFVSGLQSLQGLTCDTSGKVYASCYPWNSRLSYNQNRLLEISQSGLVINTIYDFIDFASPYIRDQRCMTFDKYGNLLQANYGSGYISKMVYNPPVAPTIGTFNDVTKNFGVAPFGLTPPTSNSSGAFTYTSSNTSVATISGSTVTLVGVCTSTITATQAVAENYTSGTATATLTVNPPVPTIGTLSLPSVNASSTSFTLTAPTSNSSSPFTYASSNNTVATISGNTVNILGPGTTTITASQAANASFSAGSVSAVLSVSNCIAYNPSNIVVSNFISSFNGTYIPNGLYNGLPVWVLNGSSNVGIRYQNGVWAIVGISNAFIFSSSSSGSTSFFPTTGWSPWVSGFGSFTPAFSGGVGTLATKSVVVTPVIS